MLYSGTYISLETQGTRSSVHTERTVNKNGSYKQNKNHRGVYLGCLSLITILLGIWSTRQPERRILPARLWKNFYAGGGNMNWLGGMMLAAGGASGGTFLSNPGLLHSWGLCGVSV